MKNKFIKVSLGLGLLAAALSLNGCVTIGYPFESHHVSSIEIGKTIQSDVRKMFGEPFRTGIQDGNQTWTYVHYHLSLLGETKTKDLFIQFYPDGTVKSYSFNTNMEADEMKKKK